MLLMRCCFQWCLGFIDIKDAFLLVPQRERVMVGKPPNRCLPGQRNAAARFFDFLCDHLQELDFENSPLLPSLFRHKTKKLILCSHVDDLVLCGERGELLWLIEELKKMMTLQGGDVLPSPDHDEQEPIRFLKRRHFFTKAGIVISPHEKYAEELVKLYGLETRKPKTTPDINGEVYDPKELDEKGRYKFRSAMGTPYLWPHQQCQPKCLILYLKGTPDLGVLLPYRVPGKSKLDEV